MNNEVKTLLAKKWKNESTEFEVGRHYIDEEIVVRVQGSVEKRADQLVSPTVTSVAPNHFTELTRSRKKP